MYWIWGEFKPEDQKVLAFGPKFFRVFPWINGLKPAWLSSALLSCLPLGTQLDA